MCPTETLAYVHQDTGKRLSTPAFVCYSKNQETTQMSVKNAKGKQTVVYT